MAPCRGTEYSKGRRGIVEFCTAYCHKYASCPDEMCTCEPKPPCKGAGTHKGQLGPAEYCTNHCYNFPDLCSKKDHFCDCPHIKINQLKNDNTVA